MFFVFELIRSQPMFLDCSGNKKHKSKTEAIDYLIADLEKMYSSGDSRFNVTSIMRRLKGLCQNGMTR
jgi:hypothetical protein